MKKSLLLIVVALAFGSIGAGAVVQASDLKELQKCQAGNKQRNKVLDALLAGPCNGQSEKLTANCQEAIATFKNKNGAACCKFYSKGKC